VNNGVRGCDGKEVYEAYTIVCKMQSLPFHLRGKTIPLQPWRGPEGSRRLRFPDFKTIGT